MIATKYREYFLVRGVFLDISKAFDKIWHKDHHYKLRQNVKSRKLLNTLINFLDNRTQKAILNGQSSTGAKVEASSPRFSS